jgi:hypothetical protein
VASPGVIAFGYVGAVLSERVVERYVARIRHDVPDAVAVFLVGSQLRGDAGPFSDIDFDVVVPDGPRDDGPGWFDDHDGRQVHISVWVRDAEQWLDDQHQAQGWAFGLPCADVLRLCWVADETWRTRLDRTALTHPADPPELGHFIGDLAKMANARQVADELALRLAAHDVALSIPSLLQPLNAGPAVTSRRAALRAALDVAVAPPGYRGDLLTCLGLTGAPTTAGDVTAAAARLATGVIDLLETHADVYAALLPADLLACLTDGTLHRYVAHLLPGPETPRIARASEVTPAIAADLTRPP